MKIIIKILIVLFGIFTFWYIFEDIQNITKPIPAPITKIVEIDNAPCKNYYKTNLLTKKQKNVILKEFQKLDLSYERIIFFAFNNKNDYKIKKITDKNPVSVSYSSENLLNFIDNHNKSYKDIFLVHNHPPHIFTFPSQKDKQSAKEHPSIKDYVFGNKELVKRENVGFVEVNEFFKKQKKLLKNKKWKECLLNIKKTKTVINLFNPNLIVRTSATPDEKQQHDANIKISLQKVVNAELIKKGHKLNEQLNEFALVNKLLGNNEILLQAALQKQKTLWQAYQKENNLVNPLIIVQLPDEKGAEAKEIREETLKFFIKEGINLENKLLAIDLSEEKENLEKLKPIKGQ